MAEKVELRDEPSTHFLCVYPTHQPPSVQYLCALGTIMQHFKESGLSGEQLEKGFNYLFLEPNKPINQ